MFIFEKAMPNGAICNYHKAVKMEVLADGTHAMVNSYHSQEMDIISWQDTYLIPPTIVVQSLADVEYLLTYAKAPFAGGTIIPDGESTLATLKARKVAALKIRRDQAEWQGVMTPLGAVDSDPTSQRKIFGKMTEALASMDTFSAEWRMKDNTTVLHDAEAMITMGKALGNHISLCHANKNALDGDIASAQNDIALEQIDIDVGWP